MPQRARGRRGADVSTARLSESVAADSRANFASGGNQMTICWPVTQHAAKQRLIDWMIAVITMAGAPGHEGENCAPNEASLQNACLFGTVEQHYLSARASLQAGGQRRPDRCRDTPSSPALRVGANSGGTGGSRPSVNKRHGE